MANEIFEKKVSLEKFTSAFKFIVEVGAVLAVIGNIWLIPKLAPLATNDVVIIGRVEALEEMIDKQGLESEDVKIIKAEVVNLKETLAEIKSDIKSINQYLLGGR